MRLYTGYVFAIKANFLPKPVIGNSLDRTHATEQDLINLP